MTSNHLYVSGIMGRYLWSCLLLSSLLVVTHAATNRSGEATYQLIYDDIQAFVGCYRRFNGTHEIGCTTDMNGNVGVIHYINSTESLNWLVDTGTHKPYVALITSSLFTGTNIKKLIKSEKVNGMLVIQTNTSDTGSYPPNGFSSDAQCPNEQSSLYKENRMYSCKQHQFNPDGTGLMFYNLNMPVMLLKSQTEVDKIINCYLTHNLPTKSSEAKLPLCAAELKAFMHAAGNTEVCMRRNNMIRNFSPDQYCQKLGGSSSHAFLSQTEAGADQKKTIVFIARTDAFSLFEYSQPGASSPAPSIAMLLSLAETLKPMKDEIISSGYNILFLALTGESFDYIGSQRLVYDMELGFFPNKTYSLQRMRLSDTHLIVELSQFIHVQDKIYVHTDPETKPRFLTIIDGFIAQLNQVPQVEFLNASANQPLPPSSSQMFIRESLATGDGLPVIVLADYDEAFQTKYYNSYLDTPEVQGLFSERSAIDYDDATPESELLSQVSTAIARAVIGYTTGNSSAALSVSASNKTIHHILYCLLLTPECELFYTVLSPNDVDVVKKISTPFPFYVSVYQSSTPHQHIQRLMLQLLAYYTGDVVQLEKDDCKDDDDDTSLLSAFWMSGPLINGTRQNRCMKSTAQYHTATSPAFDIEGYNFSSGRYSTWSESVWPNVDAFHVRIFLKPSAEVELASMVAGITLFIVAAIVSVLVQRRAAILFPPHIPEATLIADNSGDT